MPNRVYIEENATPIYKRIVQGLGMQMARCGYEVLLVKPSGFNSTSFFEFVSNQAAGIYLSPYIKNAIQLLRPGTEECYFESFKGKLVFIHHDAILGNGGLLENVAKLKAWQRVAGRSFHLCLEPSDAAHLTSLGLTAIAIPHASEIEPVEPILEGFQYGSTFVGHAVSTANMPPSAASPRIQTLIEETFRRRCADLSTPIESQLLPFVDDTLEGLGDLADRAVLRVALYHWVRQQTCITGLVFRGWVFENCDLNPLTIFGGDPGYLNRVSRTAEETWNLQVHGPGITYQPPTHAVEAVKHIYNSSKVNINITSLQFDHAVGNRFHDVIMSGGLCLTDARSGLPDLTSAHADISFRTLDELQERAAYFSRQENARQRALLIRSIQVDIMRNSGYPLLSDAIIQGLGRL